MSTLPRSLMIIHQFRPVCAGTELQAERLAGRLISLGHQVKVLTQHRDGTAEHEQINNIPVHRVRFPLAYLYHNGAEQTFRYLVQHRNEYDILHSHMAFGHAVVATVVARWLGKRSIIKIAGAGSTGELNVTSRFALSRSGHKILKQADAIVAVSKTMEEELVGWGFPSALVRRIPNGVDTNVFRRFAPMPPRQPVVFVVLGRRSPEKGFDVVLKAVKILRDRGFFNFRVDHHGFDCPGLDYRQMASELSLEGSVRFLPFSDAVAEKFNFAHAFILPSRNEGLSNALLEAMACELPVIATAISGTVDAVTDGQDGLLIRPDAPEELADAMEVIIRNPERSEEIGRNARQSMLRNFAIDLTAQRYSELYQEIACG